jgi:hypothetical protein
MAILITALDLVLPPTTAFVLLLLYPALSFIRWIKFLVGLLMCEDVRGKVILITGASSGIGEVCDSDAFQQIGHPPPPQDFAFQKCCYLAQVLSPVVIATAGINFANDGSSLGCTYVATMTGSCTCSI